MIDIVQQRLHNQLLVRPGLETPQAVVSWLGAVQSQDYGGAKWAVAQRTPSTTDATLDQALAAGTILRTHVLRPTWHFVTPADIRWLLKLTGPRVSAFSASYYRKYALDQTVFALAESVLIRALEGGKQLIRAELVEQLQAAGIILTDPVRVVNLLMQAELDGIICSGALRGKQHTYALLDERVPPTPALSREEALATLARRYLQSHGPATLKDYSWWSGLSMPDARTGFELIKADCAQLVANEQTYWFLNANLIPEPAPIPSPLIHLLPNYDEYIVAYSYRRDVTGQVPPENVGTRNDPIFSYNVALDGQLVGQWKRTLKKNTMIIEALPFGDLNLAEMGVFAAATARYSQFIGLPVIFK